MFFLLLPGLFVLGLLLIPLGVWRERRRAQRGIRRAPGWPVLDLNDGHVAPRSRLFVLTMVNVAHRLLAAYRGVEYMDSVQFCGQACHRS